MSHQDATTLQLMMAAEAPTYMTHFTAFNEPDSLLQQSQSALRDGFFTLVADSQPAGFFCLRGLDEGYEKPSFGVYVASQHQAKGLARTAVLAAEQWCREHAISTFMLKVAQQNKRAYLLYERSGFTPAARCQDSGQTIMEKRIV